MKKVFTIVATSVVALMLTTGCTSSLEMGAHIEQGDESIKKTAIYVGHAKTEDVMEAISKGAINNGWNVTKFKINAVIVEKIVDDKTISSTITYSNSHISGTNENVSMDALLDLRESIVEELQSEDSSHN